MLETIAETAVNDPSLKHPQLEGVTEREEYIADLMAADKWQSRRTKRELAAAWDVAESTIQNYSAAAHRALEAGLKEDRMARAVRAANRLETDAKRFADAYVIPGNAAASVRANEVILKMTGFAEPEEDKGRASTVVLIGQVATSPAMQALVGKPKQLNGHQDTPVVPAADSHGTVVQGHGTSVD